MSIFEWEMRTFFLGFACENKVKSIETDHQKKRSTARVDLFFWWTIKDSNLGPIGYEPSALTNCANGPYELSYFTKKIWIDYV